MRLVRSAAAAAIGAALFATQVGAYNFTNSSSGVPLKVSSAVLSNLAGTADDCGGVEITGHVTATGSVNDSGGNDNFVVQLFDDQIVKGTASFSVPVDQTQGFDFQFLFPGPVLTGAPGVGIVVSEVPLGQPITFVDPFFPVTVSGCTIGQASKVPTLSNWALGSTAAMLLVLAGWFGFSRRKS
jgi:hypothetical protein